MINMHYICFEEGPSSIQKLIQVPRRGHKQYGAIGKHLNKLNEQFFSFNICMSKSNIS